MLQFRNPCPSRLFNLCWDNPGIVPVKQPYRIWVNELDIFAKNCYRNLVDLSFQDDIYLCLEISILKSTLVNKDFQTWLLIGWQHSHQPIRSYVRKSLLTK